MGEMNQAMTTRWLVVRAWLANFVPPMLGFSAMAGFALCLAWWIFGWPPPQGVFWVIGTCWALIASYVAMAASHDYKLTLAEWARRDEPAPKKRIKMQTELRGRTITFYGDKPYQGGFNANPDRLVFNGRTLTRAEFRRGWVDLDDE